MSTNNIDIERYRAERAALISADRALRFDHGKAVNISDKETRADNVIRALRAKEAATLWNSEYDSIPHPFPGMEFLTGKAIIVKSKLFQLLTKFPKGALLHAHFDATVDPKFILDLAIEQPAIHVRAPAGFAKRSLPEIRALPRDQWTSASKLTDSPDAWVGLKTARETFDPKLGGPEGFDEWIIGAMTINPAESYGTHNTVIKIWKKFQSTFSVSSPLLHLLPIWRAYIREFLLTQIADGISYVEPHMNFIAKTMHGLNGEDDIPHSQWLSIFVQVLDEVKAEMKTQGREDEFIGAKIIYSTVKVITPEELEWYTEDCIALEKEFPDLIAGFDLVGGEDLCRPLKDYIVPLLSFVERQKEEGVDIPFLFHAGETLGDGTESDENMYDAILLGAKRIGHGFSIVKHPRLMEICREKGIALEVCPISNEILRLTSSMPMHPLPIMLNNGIPVALSSDDPAVFGSMGLSYDFYQVLVASEINGLITLRELARTSIKHSMLDDEAKVHALTAWEKRWAMFVDEVLLL